jgi:N-acetylglutamate synthase
MPSSPGHDLGRPSLTGHSLGPDVVGSRVVIRRLVPGETGPSGGPRMTDVLGVCESWTDVAVVRRQDGVVVTVPIAEIVTGKPVPPRELVRHRVSPRDAQAHSVVMWPDLMRRDLGDWILRSTGPSPGGRMVTRANSVLAMGDPEVPMADALTVVVDFYTSLGRPTWAQVLADGAMERELITAGWQPLRPGETDSMLQLGSVPRVLRSLNPPSADVSIQVDADIRATARLGELASGRAAIDRDWVGLHDLWTDPEHRGRGLMRSVLAHLLDWAASQGATTTYLHTLADNGPALRLYDRVGFLTHHTYRYFTPR